MEGYGVDWRVSMKTVNKVKMTIVIFFMLLRCHNVANSNVKKTMHYFNSPPGERKAWWRPSAPTCPAVRRCLKLGFFSWAQSVQGSPASSVRSSQRSVEESPTGPWWAAPPPPASPRRYKWNTNMWLNEYSPIFKIIPSERSLKLLASFLLSFSSISVTVLQNPRSPGRGPQRVGSVWCYGHGECWDHWNTPSWHPGHHQRQCTGGSPGKSLLTKCWSAES